MYKSLIRLITPNIFNKSELFPSLLARYSTPKLIFNETTAEIDSFFIRWKNKADYVNIQPKFFTITKKNYTPCRELWRILVVLWSGDGVPCCVDFDGKIVIGNAQRENLQSLFKNKIMREMRKKHLLKKPPSLCEKCSHYYADYYISKRKLTRAD